MAKFKDKIVSNYCKCGHIFSFHRHGMSACEGDIIDWGEWELGQDGLERKTLIRERCKEKCQQFTPGLKRPKICKTDIEKRCATKIVKIVDGKVVRRRCLRHPIIGQLSCGRHL